MFAGEHGDHEARSLNGAAGTQTRPLGGTSLEFTRSAALMDQRRAEACSSDSGSNSAGPVGEYVPMAKFGVGIGGPPDAARSPVVDYPGMPTAELVTAHVKLLLEEAGVRDMSQENVELAARWYEPWATMSKAELLADLPRAMELCHPEVEWSQREEGRTLRGREGVREALEGWLDSFDEYRFEVQRIFTCGFDEVLVVGLEVGRGAISGAEVRSHTYELLTFRDGKIVRFRDFHDEREALEAVGLSEPAPRAGRETLSRALSGPAASLASAVLLPHREKRSAPDTRR